MLRCGERAHSFKFVASCFFVCLFASNANWLDFHLFCKIARRLQKKAIGQDPFNRACVHLNLEETDYFGLTYTDHDNTSCWLDPVKKIRKQLRGRRAFTFRFQVKFFSSEPANLREEFTRFVCIRSFAGGSRASAFSYLFFLQLKHDIKTGKLPCPKEAAASLAALQLQCEREREFFESRAHIFSCKYFLAEFGDNKSEAHDIAFISEFRFHPQQDEELGECQLSVRKGSRPQAEMLPT